MNNDHYKIYCTISLCFVMLVMALVGSHSCQIISEVKKPQPTIKQQVLSYPFQDNSPALRAAEAKVNRKIDRVEKSYCERHMNDDLRCGAWFKVNGKWIKNVDSHQ
jgi:hypothetical protein